jgi:hypothetical protein
MNSIFNGPQLAYLVIALVVLGLAFAGIVWVGRIVRGELGSDAPRGGDAAGLAVLQQVPPAMMKEAIARGLVVPSQLAGMTNQERTFLFASLKQKLAAVAEPQPAPVVPPEAPAEKPAGATLPDDVPPALLAMLNAERLRVWCPMCGTELQLPHFPPLLARCAKCGMKSAVRSEEGGRYTLIVSPPPKVT